MSRRLLLQDLASRNGWAPIAELDGGELAPNSVAYTMSAMRLQKLVESRSGGAKKPAQWRITQLGRDVLDGRVVFVVRRVKGVRNQAHVPAATPAATWLASLPRAGEVRL